MAEQDQVYPDIVYCEKCGVLRGKDVDCNCLLLAELTAARAEAERLREAGEDILEYVFHKPGCESEMKLLLCDCGGRDALKDFREALSSPKADEKGERP
jgi:hypothetical protein